MKVPNFLMYLTERHLYKDKTLCRKVFFIFQAKQMLLSLFLVKILNRKLVSLLTKKVFTFLIEVSPIANPSIQDFPIMLLIIWL